MNEERERWALDCENWMYDVIEAEQLGKDRNKYKTHDYPYDKMIELYKMFRTAVDYDIISLKMYMTTICDEMGQSLDCTIHPLWKITTEKGEVQEGEGYNYIRFSITKKWSLT